MPVAHDLGLDAERAEVLGVAGDARLRRAVGLESPVRVRREGLLGAHADIADVAGQRGAADQRPAPRVVVADDELDPVEAEAGAAAAAHRPADAVGRHVAEVVDRVDDDAELRAVDLPVREAHPRQRHAERQRAEVPQQVGMRAQHQAAALRRAAAAASARVDAELDAERAPQLLAPRRFAADREEAAALAADRAVHRGADRQAGNRGHVDEIGGADEADALLARQLDALVADPAVGVGPGQQSGVLRRDRHGKQRGGEAERGGECVFREAAHAGETQE